MKHCRPVTHILIFHLVWRQMEWILVPGSHLTLRHKLMISVAIFCSVSRVFYTNPEKISLSRLAMAGTLITAVTRDNGQECGVLFRRNREVINSRYRISMTGFSDISYVSERLITIFFDMLNWALSYSAQCVNCTLMTYKDWLKQFLVLNAEENLPECKTDRRDNSCLWSNGSERGNDVNRLD